MYVYIHKLRLRKHPKISGIPAMFNQIWWMMVEKYVFNIWNKYGYMGCVDKLVNITLITFRFMGMHGYICFTTG